MCLFEAVRRFFFGTKKDGYHDLHGYRDYTPNSPHGVQSRSQPTSRSTLSANPALDSFSDDGLRSLLSHVRFGVDSRGNWNPVAANSHDDSATPAFSAANSLDKQSAVSPLSKPPSLSSNVDPAATALSPCLSSKKPPSVSGSSRYSIISTGAKFSSHRLSPSISNSAAPAPPSKSPPPKSKTAPISPTNNSTTVAGADVWRAKLSTMQDTSTKFVEKTFGASLSSKSSSMSLISPKIDSQPPAPPTKQATVSVACNTSVSKDVGIDVWLPSPESSSSSTEERLRNLKSNRRLLPKYEIPKHLEQMFKNGLVPPVLKRPLSPSTYADYFGTLLYAEDFYIEKWSKYLLNDVELELKPRSRSRSLQEVFSKNKNGMSNNRERNFVSFEIDSVPERRPFLLSRDFVFLQPLNEKSGPFKGILFRVVKNTSVLVEFGDDFHAQHTPLKRYNVSFSFNRVCMKRAHQAISLASDPSFQSIVFPNQSLVDHPDETILSIRRTVTRIINHTGPIPLLIEGPPAVRNIDGVSLSTTGVIIREAILKIHCTNPCCRILVCSPSNKTSDAVLRSLSIEIPESRLFRANAAYRDLELVPDDIIPASLYEEEEERFACAPIADLLRFNVISSTFMSSRRLHVAGIDAEHFTHMFLVDTSHAIEPEAIVPLTNFAGKSTVIVVSGSSTTFPAWVRSDIARRHGLKTSYFHRLINS